MNLIQLKEYIAPEFISNVVTPKKLDYSDIRLVCGTQTTFMDNCIYMGSLSDVPVEAYKGKLIGLITKDDADHADMEFDRIILSENTNLLALYEELKSLWNSNSIGQIVDILSMIFTSKNLNHIINQTSRIMGNPVFLIDYNSRLLAYCCDQPIDDPDIRYMLSYGHMAPQYVKETRGTDISKMLFNSMAPIMVEADGIHSSHKRLMGMIWANQRSQAMITVLEYNRRLTIADSNILGNICGMLSQLIERRSRHDRQANIISMMYETRLLALIKQEDYDLSWVSGWLSYMRWDTYQNFHTIVIQNDDDRCNSAQIMEITDKLRQRIMNRYMILHKNGIVILINARDRESFMQFIEALEDILPEYGFKAGVSKRFTQIREISEHCRQAEDAVKINQLLDQKRAVSIFDKCIPYELLIKAGGGNSGDSLRRYDDYRLQLLNEYDRRCGTDYYLTLYTYLQSACSRTQAARRLYINRNTMDYRMNKIREMLKLNDYDGEECFKLYLAFKAREMEKAAPFNFSSKRKD